MERVPRSINERRVFVDTSAILAILDRMDGRNQEAKNILIRLAEGHYRLFTTMYVVVETHASILRVMTPATGRQFLVDGLNEISLVPVTGDDEERAKKLILQRRDKDYSLCDAISFAVMERYGIYLAFAYDDHFRQHGFSTPLDRADWP